MVYDVSDVHFQKLSGWPLAMVVEASESALLAPIVQRIMFSQLGIPEFRELIVDASPELRPPLENAGFALSTPRASPDAPPPELSSFLGGSSSKLGQETITCFHEAYKSGQSDPERVADSVLKALAKFDQAETPLRALIAVKPEDLRAQAQASKQRWQRGQALGALDGVPVAIKDEVDLRGYPTTVGTSFLGKDDALEDASTVARLRAAGALLIGKANMHEIGIGVTGLNVHHGTARNPYDLQRATGGSSSGSASAVAAGLCPLALGADGGGSIRMPASLCGIVGLKPTFGRVSEHGAAPLCWSLAHIGPMAATVRDAAVGYAVMAGSDSRDWNSQSQPRPEYPDFSNIQPREWTMGIYRAWFQHADPEVVEICLERVDQLRKMGMKIKEIEIPDMRFLRWAQVISIATEMATAHARYMPKHLSDYGPDVRLNLALARGLRATDYIKAQQLRRQIRQNFDAAFHNVDFIVTPATGCTAPLYSDAALRSGESDLTTLDLIMRFATAANITGFPAISVPAGYDSMGLPIGLQAMARPWQEHRLLEWAHFVESQGDYRRPSSHFRVLHNAVNG